MADRVRSFARSRTFAFVTGFLLSVIAVIPFASAQDLIVKYDQSQLLRLPRPVAEIIIGNSSIVDVTVQSTNLLVVTGKTFGITNVISLDADRNVILDQRIMVVRDEAKVVNLQKAGKRQSYNCVPQCNPSLVVGDDIAFFNDLVRNAMIKMRFSEGADDKSNIANNQQQNN